MLTWLTIEQNHIAELVMFKSDLLSEVMLQALIDLHELFTPKIEIFFSFSHKDSVITRSSAFICGLWGAWTLWPTSTHTFLDTSHTSQDRMDTLHLHKSHTSIYHPVFILLLPLPSLLALLFCPLFALLLHLLLFSAIKARVKFELPRWHC